MFPFEYYFLTRLPVLRMATQTFNGAFVKLKDATISFLMSARPVIYPSVCPSVGPQRTTRFLLNVF